jgi:hypothetical protein
MARRIEMLLVLPVESMTRDELRAAMRRIGEAAVLDPAAEKLFP